MLMRCLDCAAAAAPVLGSVSKAHKGAVGALVEQLLGARLAAAGGSAAPQGRGAGPGGSGAGGLGADATLCALAALAACSAAFAQVHGRSEATNTALLATTQGISVNSDGTRCSVWHKQHCHTFPRSYAPRMPGEASRVHCLCGGLATHAIRAAEDPSCSAQD